MLLKISMILRADSKSMDKLQEKLTDDYLKFYKCVLMTSTDLERSFFWYKNLLSISCRKFQIENLKKI